MCKDNKRALAFGRRAEGKPSVKRRKLKCATLTSARADEGRPGRFCLQQESGCVLRSADQPQTTADESARLKAFGQAYDRGRKSNAAGKKRPAGRGNETATTTGNGRMKRQQRRRQGCQQQCWANTQTHSDERACVQAEIPVSEETT